MPNSRTSVTAPDGVAALTAAGYQVFAINPLAVTRTATAMSPLS